MRRIVFAVAAWLALCVTPAFAQGVSPAQMFGCNQSKNATLAAAGGAQVVPSVTGRQIYLCGFVIDTTGTASTGVQFEYAAAGGCAAGPYTAVTPAMAFAANTNLVDHQPFYAGLLPVPSGSDLCIVETAGTIAVIVYYTQF